MKLWPELKETYKSLYQQCSLNLFYREQSLSAATCYFLKISHNYLELLRCHLNSATLYGCDFNDSLRDM